MTDVLKKLRFVAAAAHAEKRLDAVLAEWLPGALGRPVSKAKVRKLIMAGAVLVNGTRTRLASMALKAGVTIEVHVDPVKLFEDLTARDKKFELTPDRILFEDDDLLVVNKPPGLPSQPTLDETRDNLLAAVTRFLVKRYGQKPYVGVHQRLDRDTSGVVLFTKSRRVNAAVADAFSQHNVVKVYQAVTVAGPSKREWSIRNYIGKVSSKAKRAKYGAVPSGGERAETSFRLIEKYSRGNWIEAVPKTGRTHQIRVHLAECGLPIVGDDLYGVGGSGRLMLHAGELKFPHPLSGLEIAVKSPLPADFKEILKRMKNEN
jgi:23S rRNA pseudouridine1911/1915/1917 synthase